MRTVVSGKRMHSNTPGFASEVDHTCSCGEILTPPAIGSSRKNTPYQHQLALHMTNPHHTARKATLRSGATSKAMFASVSRGNAAPAGPVSYSNTIQLQVTSGHESHRRQYETAARNHNSPVRLLFGIEHCCHPEACRGKPWGNRWS